MGLFSKNDAGEPARNVQAETADLRDRLERVEKTHRELTERLDAIMLRQKALQADQETLWDKVLATLNRLKARERREREAEAETAAPGDAAVAGDVNERIRRFGRP